MSGPSFIAVVPAEVERYGAAAAILLALIRYRTGTAGPGRIEWDGYRWWRVSHRDLASATGLSVKVVRTALRTLGGAVVANHLPPLDVQTLAYRVPSDVDAPTCQSPAGARSDLPVAPAGTDRAPAGTVPPPSGHTPVPQRASAPLSGDLGEKTGEGGKAAPPVVAPLIHHNGHSSSAHSESATPEPLSSGDNPPEDDSIAMSPDYDWFDYPDDDPDGAPAEPDIAPAVTVDAVVVDGEVVDPDPDPEPQRYCDRHIPDGTDNPCGACGRRRRIHEAWEARNQHRVMGRVTANALGWMTIAERAIARRASARTALPAAEPKRARSCGWCHDGEFVRNRDGSTGVPRVCHHNGFWHEATPDEISEIEQRGRRQA